MQDFETKRKNLFACLDEIADKSLKGTILEQTEFGIDELQTRKKLKKSQNEDLNTSKLRGKESLFKKPDLPIAKCLKPRTTPDFKINPHKWTKYSLDDADISDRMNTTAAFDFLKDLENKKSQEKDSDSDNEIETSKNKVVFKKSVNLKLCLRDETDNDSIATKAILKGSKVVMPEYVVGKKLQKGKKKRIIRKDAKKSTKELKLPHLLDIDEVNDEEDI